jgi:hypothetical protein
MEATTSFRSTFFDFLSVAQPERMHNQMLIWLLSPECEAFTHTQKIQVFNRLSGLNAVADNDITFIKQYDQSWRSFVNQDIVMRVGENVCVLDNRLRHPLHSDRLKDYHAVLESINDKAVPHTASFLTAQHYSFCYLTVCENSPIEVGWRVVRYADLLALLQSLSTAALPQHPHTIIVAEYLDTLTQFVSAAHLFLTEPECRREAILLADELYQNGEQDRYGALAPMRISLRSAADYCVAQSFFPLLTKAAWFDVWSGLQAEYDAVQMLALQSGEFEPSSLHLICGTLWLLDQDGAEEHEFKCIIRFDNTQLYVGISPAFAVSADAWWIPESIYNWFDERVERFGYERVKRPPEHSAFLALVRDLKAETGVQHSLLELPFDGLRNIIRKEISRAKVVFAELCAALD